MRQITSKCGNQWRKNGEITAVSIVYVSTCLLSTVNRKANKPNLSTCDASERCWICISSWLRMASKSNTSKKQQPKWHWQYITPTWCRRWRSVAGQYCKLGCIQFTNLLPDEEDKDRVCTLIAAPANECWLYWCKLSRIVQRWQAQEERQSSRLT